MKFPYDKFKYILFYDIHFQTQLTIKDFFPRLSMKLIPVITIKKP